MADDSCSALAADAGGLRKSGKQAMEPGLWAGRSRTVKLGGVLMVGRNRELIATGTDKRYVRRDENGRFDEVVDVGKSLAQDRRRQAKKEAKPGQGDRGDRKR
jgi:hypothetical protein